MFGALTMSAVAEDETTGDSGDARPDRACRVMGHAPQNHVPAVPARGRRARGCWMLPALMIACTAYDPALLGSGNDARCTGDTAGPAGVCPTDVAAELPAPEATEGRCGDGTLDPGESCDPPETCLAKDDCVSDNPCVRAALSGSRSTCSVRCELTAIVACTSGDACCPADCTPDRDSDCSASCGDGRVDSASETCEPSNPRAPCPKSCDDGDPCTDDHTTGSLDNCNLACSHSSIRTPRDDDGCCLASAQGADSDCGAVCGNGVLESGEECDGGADCTDTCRFSVARVCRDATAQVDGIDDRCKECLCGNCADELLGCASIEGASREPVCLRLLGCMLRTNCELRRASCYCGNLLLCREPTGECRAEAELAAATTDPAEIDRCANDLDCVIGKAIAHDACRRRSCARECAMSEP